MISPYLAVISVGMFFVLILGLFGMFLEWINVKKLFKIGKKAKGKINRLATDFILDENKKTLLVADFKDDKGKKGEASSTISYKNAKEYIGDEVEIIYDPKELNKSRIIFDIKENAKHHKFMALLLFLAACALFLISLILYYFFGL